MPDTSRGRSLATRLRRALAGHEVIVFATGAGLSPTLPVDADHPNRILSEAVAQGRPVFGYEIPGNGDPALQPFLEACRANIDPQHTRVDAPVRPVPPAAIEAAMDAAPLPPRALMITPKADLDALGAMVVHAGRSAGLDLTSPDIALRVAAIAAGDRSARGPWSAGATAAMDPVCGPLAALVADPEVPLPRRLDAVIDYLATGSFPGLAGAVQRRREHRARLDADVFAHGGVELVAGGMVAVVTTSLHGAFSIGYERAPVVIAHSPDHIARGWAAAGPRYTIGRWNSTVELIDLPALAARLNRVEPGWGGHADIIGSPLSGPSTLPLRSLVRIVGQAIGPGGA